MSTAGQVTFAVIGASVLFWSLASLISAVGVRNSARSMSSRAVFVYNDGLGISRLVALTGVTAAFIAAAFLAVGILT